MTLRQPQNGNGPGGIPNELIKYGITKHMKIYSNKKYMIISRNKIGKQSIISNGNNQ